MIRAASASHGGDAFVTACLNVEGKTHHINIVRNLTEAAALIIMLKRWNS